MDKLILIIVYKAAADALKPLSKNNITIEVLLLVWMSSNWDDVGQFKYIIKIHVKWIGNCKGPFTQRRIIF